MALPGLDLPGADLDLLVDVVDARHLEHEAGLDDRPLEDAS